MYSSELWETDTSLLVNDAIMPHLEACLKSFDWTYDFSDDFRVWKTGQKNQKHLLEVFELADQQDSSTANKLFNKYNIFLNEDGSQKE